jgi:predicted CXXCH cytochrome family protein
VNVSIAVTRVRALVPCAIAACAALVVGMPLCLAAGSGPSYAGTERCLGCHSQTRPELARTYRESAHAKAEPAADARGADLYRATVALRDDGTFAEKGVGCEACHGPGSRHRTSAMPRHLILRYGEIEPARADMVCGQCHATGTTDEGKDYPAGFLPGEDLMEMIELQDGASGKFARYNEFLGGKHYASGAVHCTTCHDPHGSADQPSMLRSAVPDLCAACHPDEVAQPAEHTPGGEVGTCVSCHMPEGSHD